MWSSTVVWWLVLLPHSKKVLNSGWVFSAWQSPWVCVGLNWICRKKINRWKFFMWHLNPYIPIPQHKVSSDILSWFITGGTCRSATLKHNSSTFDWTCDTTAVNIFSNFTKLWVKQHIWSSLCHLIHWGKGGMYSSIGSLKISDKSIQCVLCTNLKILGI